MKIVSSNAIFSYLDIIKLKVFECDNSPFEDVQRCWNYMEDNDVSMFYTHTTVSMHGYETFDILDNNYPQNKMYKFYKCLNTDWTQWLAFNPKVFYLKQPKLDRELIAYGKVDEPGLFDLCAENKTHVYEDQFYN